MDIPEPNFAVTPYGDVDAVALQLLRNSFDTSRLLSLYDALGTLEIGELRDELLRLHRMANTVINGAKLCEPGKEDIWEVAEALIDEFTQVAETCVGISESLRPLAALRPDHQE
jgi:hypothetical protein